MKRPTRQLALSVALQLFNEKGVEAVNTRDIAQAAGISLGNLTYHFPTKTSLVHALCLALVSEVSAALNALDPRGLGLWTLMFRQVEAIFRTQLRFRFILNRRYADILVSVPAMQRSYQDVLKDRFDQFRGLHAELVRQELATAALLAHADAHFYVLNLLALYWQQEASIYFPHYSDEQQLRHGLATYFQSYAPYLTARGAAELLPLLAPLRPYREVAPPDEA